MSRPRSTPGRYGWLLAVAAATALLTVAPWLARPRGLEVDLGPGALAIVIVLGVSTLVLALLLLTVAFYACLETGRARRWARLLGAVSIAATATQVFATWYWLGTPQWDVAGIWLLVNVGSLAAGALLALSVLGLDVLVHRILRARPTATAD